MALTLHLNTPTLHVQEPGHVQRDVLPLQYGASGRQGLQQGQMGASRKVGTNAASNQGNEYCKSNSAFDLVWVRSGTSLD